MNVQTARDFYDGFDEEQKAQTKALIKSGVDRVTAVRRVKQAQVGDVVRDAQPDLDAAESNPSTLENVGAFAQGAARSASLGLDDEVAGVAHVVAPWNLIPAMIDKGDDGVVDTVGKLYREGRDDQRDANAAFDRFAPTATGSGKVFGTLAQAVLPSTKAVSVAKAAPSFGRAILEAARLNGSLGAASGFGEDEGNVATNTLKGGATGAAFGAATALVAGLANPEVRRDVADAARATLAGARTRIDAAKQVKPIDLAEIALGKDRIEPLKRLEAATREAPVMSADEAGAVVDAPNPYEGATWSPPETSSTNSGLKLQPPPMPKAKVNFLAPVDEEVAARTAALDELAAQPSSQLVVKRPAKAWASVGDEEKTAALEAAAQDAVARFGSPDRAAIQSATGMPSGDLDRLLPNVARRVAAGAGGAVDDVGGNVRRAKETARALPAVDPEGRPANQMKAINEASTMKAEFNALPADQRAAYVQKQLAKGMAPDVLRRRLGITEAEWRRTSFSRAAAAGAP
jgi:hypothetical protein